MAWSLQFSLPAAEQSLEQISKWAGDDPDAARGAVEGVVQMLAAWPDELRPSPEAAELVSVLERGQNG